jgi:regulator of protease activity HflC (stomatin/prohibitin superfamily)
MNIINVLLFLFFVIMIAAIAFLSHGVVIISRSQTMVIERFGSRPFALSAGLHFLIPFFHRPRPIMEKRLEQQPDGKIIGRYKLSERISLQQILLDFPEQHAITKDNAPIHIDALMFYQITDPIRAVYEAENLPLSLEAITQTALRDIIGAMTLDETLASRERINTNIRMHLEAQTDSWGVRISRVEIQDIILPEDLLGAMEKQMKADREKRALILEAEGNQRAAILKSLGEREAKINSAEAEKRATILEATGKAVAQIRLAQAEAEAINRVSESMARIKGNPENYLILTRYLETLKEMVSGKDNKVVYIPYEAVSMLSSLGSIRDLFVEKTPVK